MIRIQNIYYMLAYAFQVLNEQGYKNIATEEFDNTAELCAAILARGISTQVKRGLGKEYIPQTEALSSLRGKLDISESIKTQTFLKKQMICSYDDFGDMLPVMQTDIMLTKDEKTLIIDAKYYAHTTQRQYDKNTLHSGNLYQIFTYVKNKEAELAEQPHKVAGMLLYARTDEEIYPEKEYRMSGNQIGVRTLNLDGDFDMIKSQLNEIAEKFFGKAA